MTHRLLFEIGCEPIPSCAQKNALASMKRLMEKYVAPHMTYGQMRCYITCHRMAFIVDDARISASCTPRKGPLVSMGEKAFLGFAKSANVDVDACYQENTPKGMAWFAPPPPLPVLADVWTTICEKIMHTFDWPKKMVVWDGQEWIGPVRTLVCMDNATVLPLRMGPLTAGNMLCVHRLSGQGDGIHRNSGSVVHLDDACHYESVLRTGNVTPDFDERAAHIADMVDTMARNHNAEIIPASGTSMIATNAGLCENPVIHMGRFDARFLELPTEVISAIVNDQQKCITLQDRTSQAMIPIFAIVTDGHVNTQCVTRGYEQVIGSRLDDGLFFWNKDKKTPLTDLVQALHHRTFVDHLGSMHDKTMRVQQLACHMACSLDETTQHQASQAAELCYADLSTTMVKEFPGLQGIIGAYYAAQRGMPATVADAIRQRTQFYTYNSATDTANAVSALLAIADGIDTLVGFFALDKAPTGSKDPFALRRTSHSVWRAALMTHLNECVADLIPVSLALYHAQNTLQDIHQLPALDSFLHDRLLYVVGHDRPGIKHCIRHFNSQWTGKHIQEQCETTEQIAHCDPFVAAYRRIHSVCDTTVSLPLNTDQLTLAAEQEIIKLMDKNLSVDLLDPWTQALNTFMDDVLIHDAPYYNARMSLVQHVVRHFHQWPALSCLSAS